MLLLPLHQQHYTHQSKRNFPLNPKLIIFLIALLFCALFIKMDTFTPEHEIPIHISISEISTINHETPTLSLKVTLHNTSSKPISFLRWSTPFDLRAVRMGIFKFKSVATGELAPCLNIKLNRKMPREGVFADDDIVSIDAGGEESRIVEIGDPEVVLVRGERYVVSAKGFWMHVFVGEREEAKKTDADVLRGDFESEGVEVKV